MKVDSGLLFYQNTTATDGTKFDYPSTTAASFVNNGMVYLNEGFEGFISTEKGKSSSSQTEFSWFAVAVSDSKEGTSSSVYSWGGPIGLIESSDGVTTKEKFSAGSIYSSSSNSETWVHQSSLEKIDIKRLSIIADKTESEENKVGTFNLEASISPLEYGSTNIIYQWSIKDGKSGATFSDTASSKTVVTTEAAGTSSSKKYTVVLTITFTKIDGTTGSLTSEIEITAKCKSCILPTALVLMANGTYREAGTITTGDMVIAFNHKTGKLEPNVIIVNAHKDEVAKDCNVLHLSFENGVETGLVYKHGYFDLDLNKYVYLSIDNYQNFIGHRFVYVDANLNRSEVKLLSGKVSRMYTKVVSPVTAKHLDLVIDNMLGLSSSLDGLFNIFEYDSSTLAFDEDKMKRDIDKYGLLDYEYFKDYFPKEIYDLLPCKYLGVSIGKGLITWDIIKSYISKWKDQLMENMK